VTYIITLRGETLHLLPQRAVYRPANHTLYIADTHWGKPATFRAHYVPLPEGGLADELAQLSDALAQTAAERLVILGDLTHSGYSMETIVIETVAAWRARYAQLQVELVPGNHDRHVKTLPAAWQINTLPAQVDEGGFVLSHTPVAMPDQIVLCGHLHPAWVLQGKGRQQISLPCFIETAQMLVLPAFTRFTGSVVPKLDGIRQVYGVTETRVLALLQHQ
jgi:hypothetical protein